MDKIHPRYDRAAEMSRKVGIAKIVRTASVLDTGTLISHFQQLVAYSSFMAPNQFDVSLTAGENVLMERGYGSSLIPIEWRAS